MTNPHDDDENWKSLLIACCIRFGAYYHCIESLCETSSRKEECMERETVKGMEPNVQCITREGREEHKQLLVEGAMDDLSIFQNKAPVIYKISSVPIDECSQR